jgi:hypothetical protein
MTVDINFQIYNTQDPKTIIIGDQSTWGVAENHPAYLQVTPPGTSTATQINFVKKNLMHLTSISLGLSCSAVCEEQNYEDLPDGVWEFCLQSKFEGLNKKRFFLKDDQLRQKIDKIRIGLYDTQGFTYVKNKTTEQLETIDFLISASQALIKEGRNSDAMKAYNEINKIVDKLKKCKDCI